MITPLDIENKKFSKQMMNGYSVEEVDDFLDELTVDYTKNYKELNEKNNGTKEVEDKHPVEVKTSKFKEFYDKSKGKLKQAFDKLKEIFGKDKQVDISKENDDEIKQ